MDFYVDFNFLLNTMLWRFTEANFFAHLLTNFSLSFFHLIDDSYRYYQRALRQPTLPIYQKRPAMSIYTDYATKR